MDVLTGAMGNLAPKLLQLLQDEYNLPKELKEQVKSVSKEMKFMKAALEKLGEGRPDQLDPQLRIWSGEVRESLYDMEDVVDNFLVRVKGGPEVAGARGRLKHSMDWIGGLFRKGKARHNIASAIRDIKKQLDEVKDMRDKYKVEEAKPAAAERIDPRLGALYQNTTSKLVGIDKPRDALIGMLSISEDDTSSKELQKVWVVGSGGLGKTTLAKAAYDKVKLKFDCCAFVQVGQTPVAKKVLKDILVGLIKDSKERNSISDGHDKEMYIGADLTGLEAEDLISHLHEFLQGKRYLIVVDDIWHRTTWKDIGHAFVDSNPGSRIVMTSRNSQLAEKIGGKKFVINKLSEENSRKLFGARISEEEGDKSLDIDKISDQILKKCAGVPLAIIAIASLLATKPRREWPIVYKSIGFEPEGDSEFDDMMNILSFSYYDLPTHLKTCMLYLSVFPEDYFVDKNSLIWRWIAEGLVPVEKGKELFQVGESYFHELINRGLILPVDNRGILEGCRVHDFVLELIRKLASEENFVVIPDSELRLPEDRKVRRLALPNILDTKNSCSDKDGDIRHHLAAARSLNAINTSLVPPVDGCKLLRLLALQNCSVEESYLKHVGKQLPHLRYLGLTWTRIRKLPANLGNLKFMQALMLQDTGIEELPESLGQLTQVMCLRCDKKTRVPDWIGNLTSLVELQMYPGAAGTCFVNELGKLTNLRVLKTSICLQDEGEAIDLLWSLSKLKKIEIMEVNSSKQFVLTAMQQQQKTGVILDSRNLRVLVLDMVEFPRMPEWINVGAFPHLCHLLLLLTKVGQEDMKTLARFQQLQILTLHAAWCVSDNMDLGDVIFKNLVVFRYNPKLTTEKLFFQMLRAMPRLEQIVILISVLKAKVQNQKDFGISGTLSSLQGVTARLICAGSFPAEVEEVKAAIWNHVRNHPNRPSLQVYKLKDDEGEMANTNSGLLSRLGLLVGFALYQLKEKVEEIGEMAQARALDDHVDDYFHKVRGFLYHCLDTVERAVRGRILWRNQLSDEDHREDGRLQVQRFVKSLEQYILSLLQQDQDVHQVTKNIEVLEEVLERLTAEIPRLHAMWGKLKAELSQQPLETVGQLTQLICLPGHKKTRVTDWIGNMTHLVELQMYPDAAACRCFVKQLGKLTNLEVLKTEICVQDAREAIDLLQSLSKLKEIEIMEVHRYDSSSEPFMLTEGAMQQQQQPGLILGSGNLRVLRLGALRYPKMPEWINVEAFPLLCQLSLNLTEVEQEDVKTLARFEQLQFLDLFTMGVLSDNVDLADVKFQNLEKFYSTAIWGTQKLLFFKIQRAMPKLEDIYITIPVLIAKIQNQQDFGFSGTTLCSLQRVTIVLFCEGSFPAEVEEVEAAIRHQVSIHPNRPMLQVIKRGDEEGKMATTKSGLLIRLSERVKMGWERVKEKVQEIGEMAQRATAGDDVDDYYLHSAIHHKVRGFWYHCLETVERAVHGRILWRNLLNDEDGPLVKRFEASLTGYLQSLASFQPDRDLYTETKNIAVLEEVLERFSTEIPQLDAMWEELKAELSQEASESLRQLTQLMCLLGDETMRVPDWITNLMSLLDLHVNPGAACKCFVKQLGKLTNLRELKIHICVQDEAEAIELLRSLSKLEEIEIMEIRSSKPFMLTEGAMQRQQQGLALGCRNLHVFKLAALSFPRMPKWINVEAFPDLCQLVLYLTEVGHEDVKKLAKFQHLQFLNLYTILLLSDNVDLTDIKFENLVAFNSTAMWGTQKIFFKIQRAMPRLKEFCFPIPVLIAKLENQQDFGFSGTSLCSLVSVTAVLYCDGSFPAEVEEVAAAIKHQIGTHPNRPRLQVLRAGDEGMMATRNPGLLLRLGERVRLAWVRLKEKVEEIGEMAQETAGNEVDDYFYAAIHYRVRGFRYHCFDTVERAVRGRILWRNYLGKEDHREDGRLLVQRFDRSLIQYVGSLAWFRPDRDAHQVTENIAVLEQVLERLDAEIPRLDAMWVELKSEICQRSLGGAGADKIASIVPDETGKEDEPFQLFD